MATLGLTGFMCQFRDLHYDRIWLDGSSLTTDDAELTDIRQRVSLPLYWGRVRGALSVANSNNSGFTLFLTDGDPSSEFTLWEEVGPIIA